MYASCALLASWQIVIETDTGPLLLQFVPIDVGHDNTQCGLSVRGGMMSTIHMMIKLLEWFVCESL